MKTPFESEEKVWCKRPRHTPRQPPSSPAPPLSIPAQLSRRRPAEGGQTVNHPSHPSDPPHSAEKTTAIIHPWHLHRHLPLDTDTHTHTHTYKGSAEPHHLCSPKCPIASRPSPSLNSHHHPSTHIIHKNANTLNRWLEMYRMTMTR